MTSAAPGNSDESIFTVADPQNFNKDELIFDGTTENAGKIMVTKTVSDKEITVDGKTFMPTANNFNVFLSKAAQSYGLTTETSVPLDVVFVLDMSNSMLNGNSSKWLNMINAANSAIKSVLSANEDNRISVVGFSTTATVLSDLSSDYSDTEDHLTYTRSQYGYSSTITVTGGQRNKSFSTGTNNHVGMYLGAQQLSEKPLTEHRKMLISLLKRLRSQKQERTILRFEKLTVITQTLRTMTLFTM